MISKHSLFCLMTLLMFVGYVNAQQNVPDKQKHLPVPQGLILYPKPAAESQDMYCGNYSSEKTWFVSLEKEQLKTQFLSEIKVQNEPLPFLIKLKKTKNAEDGLGGRRIVQRVDNGWLVGFNQGEFGGSLWWFSFDGKQFRKILNGNIKYFVKISNEILVLEGLAHLGDAEGRVLRIQTAKDEDYKIEILAILDGEPDAFVVESEDALLILTTVGLRRVKMSGVIEKLIETDYGYLYPTSMVLMKNGVLYVGMRRFITRLIPDGDSYKDEWLVSAACPKFEVRTLDCVCISKNN